MCRIRSRAARGDLNRFSDGAEFKREVKARYLIDLECDVLLNDGPEALSLDVTR